MEQHKRFIAREHYSRLDHFLNESLPDMSRSKVVKLINEGHFSLNGTPVTKKNQEVILGDVVDMVMAEEEKQEYRPSFELRKLFEDQYLLIIDKPCGVPVHPGSGEQMETILDVFRFHYPQVSEISDGDNRPGIVHRLDKDTSGVLVLAKDLITMKRIQKQFKRREVHKVYYALTAGELRYRNGTIDAPIARSLRHRTRFIAMEQGDAGYDNAREAVTEFSVIRYYPVGNFSLVKLFPHTGRTHQLRVHLTHYGNPILGDPLYGKNKRIQKSKGKNPVAQFGRLGLHAYSIEFMHPHTGNIIQSFSELPPVFRDFLRLKVNGK